MSLKALLENYHHNCIYMKKVSHFGENKHKTSFLTWVAFFNSYHIRYTVSILLMHFPQIVTFYCFYCLFKKHVDDKSKALNLSHNISHAQSLQNEPINEIWDTIERVSDWASE